MDSKWRLCVRCGCANPTTEADCVRCGYSMARVTKTQIQAWFNAIVERLDVTHESLDATIAAVTGLHNGPLFDAMKAYVKGLL